MNRSKRSVLIPLLLFIVLFTVLAWIVGYIVQLHLHPDLPDGEAATPAPTAYFLMPTAAPVSTALPEETATPVPASDAAATPNHWQFDDDAEHFWLEGALRLSADSYRSPTLSVDVKTIVDTKTFGRRVTYYVADIFVRDVTQIRTESCFGNFQKRGYGSVESTAKAVNALVAISGDYCGFHADSLVIRNGKVYRQTMHKGQDVCLLLRDGTMETILYSDTDFKKIVAKDPWQAWQFGPALLDLNGEARTTFPESRLNPRNPRCCIGYVDPGHYLFVVVDGRQKSSRGVTLTELASLMQSLGCRRAYNLDGGASAHFYWRDEIYSNPSGGGRKMSDIIYVAKESYPDAHYYPGKDGM